MVTEGIVVGRCGDQIEQFEIPHLAGLDSHTR
jgi:hypothetical protein